MPDYRLDKDLVRHVAEVAHLELTDKELEWYSKQLETILQAFKEIDEVDTENIEPSFHPIPLENVLREDVAEDWDWTPLSNTEHKEKLYFRGPKIT